MLITLFLFNPLVARFGVRNLALLQPLVFGAVFLWFAGEPGLSAAIAGFLSYHAIMMAIDINNGNLLVVGLPTARRKELRTFIEGICLPVAAAAAGLFLLVVAPDMSVRGVALIGLAGAGLTFGFNLVVRHDYVGAIAANLRSGWLDLSALLMAETANGASVVSVDRQTFFALARASPELVRGFLEIGPDGGVSEVSDVVGCCGRSENGGHTATDAAES